MEQRPQNPMLGEKCSIPSWALADTHGGVDEPHSLTAAESFVLPNFISPSEKLISSSPTHEITDSQQLGQFQWEENNTE